VSELRFRAVTRDDVDAVAAMVGRCDATYAEWAGDWEQPSAQAEAEEWERKLERPGGWVQGAFDGNAVVGAVSWRQADDETSGEIPGVAHVGAVFTDPAHWRRGIASALLERAEAEMRRRGFRVARLWTPRDAPARGFYEAEGWAPDGRERFEEKFGLELVGYEKRLHQ
jgi:GNAT superfamily N-acetyltransferase